MWRRRLSKHRGREKIAEMTTVSELNDDVDTFEAFLEKSQKPMDELNVVNLPGTPTPDYDSNMHNVHQPKPSPVEKNHSNQANTSTQESVSLVFNEDGSLVANPNDDAESTYSLTRQDSLGNESIIRARSVLADLEHQLKTAKKKGRSVDRKQLLVALLSFIESIEEREVIEDAIMSMREGEGAREFEDEYSNESFDAKHDEDSTMVLEDWDRVRSGKSSQLSHSTDKHSTQSTHGEESTRTGVTGTTFGDDDDDDDSSEYSVKSMAGCIPCSNYFHDESMRDALNDVLFILQTPGNGLRLGDSSVGSTSDDSTAGSMSKHSKEKRISKDKAATKANVTELPLEMKKSRSWWRRQLGRSSKSKKSDKKSEADPVNDFPTDIVVKNKPPKKSDGDAEIPPPAAMNDVQAQRAAVDYFLFDQGGTRSFERLKNATSRESNTDQGGGQFSHSLEGANNDSKQELSATNTSMEGEGSNGYQLEATHESFPYLGRSSYSFGRSRSLGRSFSFGRSVKSKSSAQGVSSKSEKSTEDSFTKSSASEAASSWNAIFDKPLEGTDASNSSTGKEIDLTKRRRGRSLRRRFSSKFSENGSDSISNTKITISNDDSASLSSFDTSFSKLEPTQIEVRQVTPQKNRSKSVGAFIRKRLPRNSKTPGEPKETENSSLSAGEVTSTPYRPRSPFRRRSKSKKRGNVDVIVGENNRHARITVYDHSK